MTFLAREPTDAFAAEMTALLIAFALAASQDRLDIHIVGDCSSALDTARTEACPRQRSITDQAILDLRLLATCRGNVITFQHVKSHEGLPGNEFAASAAKAVLRDGLSTELGEEFFGHWIRSRRFGCAWVPFSGMSQKGEILGLDDTGLTLPDRHDPLPAFRSCITMPGIPAPLTDTPDMSEVDACWDMNLATYNVNTLKKEADKQTLDYLLHSNQVHVAGVQESRCFPGARFQTAHDACFASADVRGNLGCQIWVSTKLSAATRQDGLGVTFEHRSATVVHSSPRLLAICVPAGKLLFGLVSAHAPIEAAPADERTDWWDLLSRVRRSLPRRAIPVLFVDGNARFDAIDTRTQVHTATAATDNARRLQSLGADAGL